MPIPPEYQEIIPEREYFAEITLSLMESAPVLDYLKRSEDFTPVGGLRASISDATLCSFGGANEPLPGPFFMAHKVMGWQRQDDNL